MSAPGWDGILDADEEILWQGAPRPGVDWSKLVDVQTIFGIFFTGFAIFWMTMAGSITSDFRNPPPFLGLFPLFGLIFVGVGLNMVIGRHLWAAYKRQGTHYTLTTKAAYIATQPLGKRSLQRVGFEEMTGLSLIDNTPGDVIFGERLITHTHRNRNSIGGTRRTTTRVPFGFHRIDEARQVWRMLRDAREAPEDS